MRALTIIMLLVVSARADVYSSAHPRQPKTEIFVVDKAHEITPTHTTQCSPEVVDDTITRLLDASTWPVIEAWVTDGELKEIRTASRAVSVTRVLGTRGFIDRDNESDHVSFFVAVDHDVFTFGVIVRGERGAPTCVTKYLGHARKR